MAENVQKCHIMTEVANIIKMTSVNISLPEVLKDYIDEQVAIGGYGTVSEYIRDLIRQDQRHRAEKKLEMLLLEGLDSGEPTPITSGDWEAVRNKVSSKISRRIAERRMEE